MIGIRYKMLQLIKDQPDITQMEIAEKLGLNASQVKDAIKYFKAQGYTEARIDDVTKRPGYSITFDGLQRVAQGPGTVKPSPKPHQQFKVNAAAEEQRKITTEVVQQIVDVVNHPPHYTQGGIECIDAIRAALTADEWRGYVKGNALKYIWRERHKGGDESIAKAAWYLERIK